MTSIPVVFTKIKRKIEANTNLDDKSKLIVLHVLKQVFKEIPKEDLIDDSYIPSYTKEDLGAFKDFFPWMK